MCWNCSERAPILTRFWRTIPTSSWEDVLAAIEYAARQTDHASYFFRHVTFLVDNLNFLLRWPGVLIAGQSGCAAFHVVDAKA